MIVKLGEVDPVRDGVERKREGVVQHRYNSGFYIKLSSYSRKVEKNNKI